MKKWTFTEKKLGVDCVLTIDDRARIEVKVGDNKPTEVKEINWGGRRALMAVKLLM